jgi:hypothetical protein
MQKAKSLRESGPTSYSFLNHPEKNNPDFGSGIYELSSTLLQQSAHPPPQ